MTEPPQPSPENTVLLVDASPYIFRAYYSLPESIKSPDGARVRAASAVTPLPLVHARPYLSRAYSPLPESIKSPDGARVGAVYGFITFLLKLIADERPTHFAVAFDRNLNGSFRNDEYPEYKAQRQDPPADLVSQIDPCLEVTEAMGIATFIDEHYEADDLIATVLARAVPAPHRCVVVSSDKDLSQLVS